MRFCALMTQLFARHGDLLISDTPKTSIYRCILISLIVQIKSGNKTSNKNLQNA